MASSACSSISDTDAQCTMRNEQHVKPTLKLPSRHNHFQASKTTNTSSCKPTNPLCSRTYYVCTVRFPHLHTNLEFNWYHTKRCSAKWKLLPIQADWLLLKCLPISTEGITTPMLQGTANWRRRRLSTSHRRSAHSVARVLNTRHTPIYYRFQNPFLLVALTKISLTPHRIWGLRTPSVAWYLLPHFLVPLHHRAKVVWHQLTTK